MPFFYILMKGSILKFKNKITRRAFSYTFTLKISLETKKCDCDGHFFSQFLAYLNCKLQNISMIDR